MAEGVQVAQLTVQAGLDASKYVEGARAKEAADKAMAASGKAADATITDSNRKLDERANAWRRIERSVDPVVRAQDALRAQEQRLQRQFDAGKVGKEDYDRVLGKLRASYAAVERQQQSLGRSVAQDISSRFEAAANRIPIVGGALARLGPIGLVAAAGVAVVGGALFVLAEKAAQAERATLRLNAVLKATGNTTGLSGSAIGQFSADLTRRTLATPQGVSLAAAQLATTGTLAGENFKEAISLGQDLVAIFGGDLPQAVQRFADAAENPVEGLQKFKKAGIDLNETQRETVRRLAESGQRFEAYKVIIDEVRRRIGGSGEAEAGGLVGATARLGKEWDRTLTEIGKTLPLTAASAAFGFMADQLERFNKARADVVTRDEMAQPTQRPGLVGSNLFAKDIARRGVPYTTFDPEAFVGFGGDAATNAAQEAIAEKNRTDQVRALVIALDETGQATQRLRAEQALLDERFAKGKVPLEDYARSTAEVTRRLNELNTAENRAARREEQITAAGMQPAARAGYMAALAVKTVGGTAEEQARARADAMKVYFAGISVGIRQQIEQADQQAAGLIKVAEAYAISTKAGEAAEIGLRAEIATRELGAEAAHQLTEALLQEAAARKFLEGVQLNRDTQDELTIQQKFTEAMQAGTQALSDAQIMAQVWKAVQRGLFEWASEGANQYKKSLEDIRDELLKQQAIQANRQFDPAERYKAANEELERLRRTGMLTARAELEMWRQKEIEKGRASQNFVDGAIAGMLEYQRQAEQSGRAAADAVMRAFEQLEEVLARLSVGMEVNFRQMLRGIQYEMNRMLIRQYITGPMAGAGANAMGGQNAYGGGMGGSNPLGSIMGLFSGGAGASSGTVGVANQWQPVSAPIGSIGAGGTMAGETAGLGASGQAGGFMGAGGMSGMGFGAGMLGIGMGAYNMSQAQTRGGRVAAGGQMVGSAMMMVPNPWVQAAGAVIMIGSQIAGAIMDRNARVSNQATTNIAINPAGSPWSYAASGNNTAAGGASAATTGQAADAVSRQINRIMYDIGARPGARMLGGYLLNSTGQHTGNQWIAGMGDYNLGVPLDATNTHDGMVWDWRQGWVPMPENNWQRAQELQAGLTAEEAAGRVITEVFRRAANDNQLVDDGSDLLTETVLTVLRNTMSQTNDELQADIQTARSYDTMVAFDRDGDAARDAIEEVRAQFRALEFDAGRLGLALDPLRAAMGRQLTAMADDHARSITDEILSVNDPIALGMANLGRWRDEQLDTIQAFLDAQVISAAQAQERIADIYRLYGIRQTGIVEQVTGAMVDNLEALIRNLTYGSLSSAAPANVLSGAQATYQAALAQAMTGDRTAQASYAGYATDYINAARGYYANDTRMADILAAVTDNARDLQAYVESAAGIAATATSSATDELNNTISRQQDEIEALTTNVADLVASNQELVAQMGRVLSRLDLAA